MFGKYTHLQIYTYVPVLNEVGGKVNKVKGYQKRNFLFVYVYASICSEHVLRKYLENFLHLA